MSYQDMRQHRRGLYEVFRQTDAAKLRPDSAYGSVTLTSVPATCSTTPSPIGTRLETQFAPSIGQNSSSAPHT